MDKHRCGWEKTTVQAWIIETQQVDGLPQFVVVEKRDVPEQTLGLVKEIERKKPSFFRGGISRDRQGRDRAKQR